MKKAKTLGLLLLILCTVTIAGAQEMIPENSLKPDNIGFYTGGHASTNGFGVNLGYIMSKRITFRTGFETLKLNIDFDFDENDVTYDGTVHYKTGGIFLLADYYYTPRLYLTAGGLINSFNPAVDGGAASAMEYGDIMIPAEDVGTFDFDVEPDVKYSPYVAAGVRSFIGKKEKVAYSFETGFYYMGAPKLTIETTGLLSPTSDPAHRQAEYLENQFDAYKIYPVIKFNLAFKIF
jgi:hypothetical protein